MSTINRKNLVGNFYLVNGSGFKLVSSRKVKDNGGKTVKKSFKAFVSKCGDLWICPEGKTTIFMKFIILFYFKKLPVF